MNFESGGGIFKIKEPEKKYILKQKLKYYSTVKNYIVKEKLG